MSQPTDTSPPQKKPEPALKQELAQAQQDDDPAPRAADAVTDCGVAPGHNRLEDREGA